MPVLYRSMRPDSDGYPETGAGTRMLGARPNVDIPLQEDERVYPGTEGMSVAPDDPRNLPEYRRPPEFGGDGKDPVWKIDSADLGPELAYAPDNSIHGFIEPITVMDFRVYQEAIFGTREFWTRVLN